VTYSVYRSVSSGFTPGPSNLIVADLTGTTYSDSDALVDGTTYYYVVRAKDLSNGVEDGNLVEHSAAPSGPSTRHLERRRRRHRHRQAHAAVTMDGGGRPAGTTASRCTRPAPTATTCASRP